VLEIYSKSGNNIRKVGILSIQLSPIGLVKTKFAGEELRNQSIEELDDKDLKVLRNRLTSIEVSFLDSTSLKCWGYSMSLSGLKEGRPIRLMISQTMS
jgi:hypothetical protein